MRMNVVYLHTPFEYMCLKKNPSNMTAFFVFLFGPVA